MKIPPSGYKLLATLQHIVKLDLAYILKGGSLMIVGQIVTTLSGLALALVFANVLPKETYGTYKYILSVIGVLTFTTLPGINGVVSQAVAEGAEGSFLPALRAKIKWGVWGSVLCICFALYYFVFAQDTIIASSFLIAAFFLPIMDSLSLYTTYLQSKKLFRLSIQYYVISQLIATTTLLLVVWLTHDIRIILLAYFVPWTVARYICLQLSLKKFPPNSQRAHNTFAYGFHLSLVGIIGQVANFADSLILFNVLGPIEVAINAVSVAPADQVKNFLRNVPTLVVPKLAKRTIAEINEHMVKRLLYLAGVGVLISLFFVIIMPYVFPLVFPKYADMYHYASLYSLTFILRIPLSFLHGVVQAKTTHFPKSWFYYGSIPNIILIITLLIITPLYGIIGVIICRYINVILNFVVTILQWKLLSKRHL